MKKLIIMLFALSAVILMSACSSDSAPASTSLTGTAATGAPIVGTVTAKDANGAESPVSLTGTDGSFSLDVAGMTPPYLLKIVPSDGVSPTLYSYATTNGQTVNLTSTTNLALFLASGKTDLAAMYTAWDGTAVTAAAVATAEGVVRANLVTQITAAGLDPATIDLFTTPFAADSTGIDGVMDNLIVTADFGAGTYVFTDGSGADLGFDENAVPPEPAAPTNAISIVTVTGATHALNGTYYSACYTGGNGNTASQIDSLTVSGTTWINSANAYANADCSGSVVVSSITATITKSADIQISGWLLGDEVAPSGLLDNETVTTFAINVTSVTGTAFNGVPLGNVGNGFYVFDDRAANFIMYRDKDGASASKSDPYITR